MAHSYNISYFGRLKSGGLQPTHSSWDPHVQNNQSKMDGRYGSSSKAPALQQQTPPPPKKTQDF
jgi:hypothetical protein